MKKPLIGALFAVLFLGAGIAPATAATGQDTADVRVKAVDLAGTVALSLFFIFRLRMVSRTG